MNESSIKTDTKEQNKNNKVYMKNELLFWFPSCCKWIEERERERKKKRVDDEHFYLSLFTVVTCVK